MQPTIDSLNSKGYNIAKIDADIYSSDARNFGVTSFPTFIPGYYNGNKEWVSVGERIPGGTSDQVLKSKFDPINNAIKNVN